MPVDFVRKLQRKAPGTRGWHRLLDRIADAGAEREVIAELKRRGEHLRADELTGDAETWAA